MKKRVDLILQAKRWTYLLLIATKIEITFSNFLMKAKSLKIEYFFRLPRLICTRV